MGVIGPLGVPFCKPEPDGSHHSAHKASHNREHLPCPLRALSNDHANKDAAYIPNDRSAWEPNPAQHSTHRLTSLSITTTANPQATRFVRFAFAASTPL